MICHHGTHFLQLLRPILKIPNNFNHLKQKRNLAFKKDLRERWKIQWNVLNRSTAGAPSYTTVFNIAELLERVKVPVTLALEFINEVHQQSCFQKPQYIVRLFWYQLSIYMNTEFFHPSCLLSCSLPILAMLQEQNKSRGSRWLSLARRHPWKKIHDK